MSQELSTDLGAIEVQTGFSPEYLARILTRDINCLESILDLIDNSIDSIRESCNDSGRGVDRRGFPTDYSDYSIDVNLSKDRISIADNGAGVEPRVIAERLLMIGAESNARLAIGHFGVGLKRAMLKLGRRYVINTSNSKGHYQIDCKSDDLLVKSIDRVVAATTVKPSQLEGTLVQIMEINSEALLEVLGKEWEDRIRKEISIRYSLMINKGLTVRYNHSLCPAICPGLRTKHSITPVKDVLHLSDEMIVDVEAGMHEDYRIKGEIDYEDMKDRIAGITSQYGWYFVCNERVIKIADHSKELGWSTRWHQEYYGFVGWVHFTGAVSLLPWNTKKTDINPQSSVILDIRDRLIKYADAYRRASKKLKKGQGDIDHIWDSISPNGKPEERKTGDLFSHHNEATSYEGGGPFMPSSTKPANSESDSTKSSESQAAPKLEKSRSTKIIESLEIIEKLNALRSPKLSNLYSSLCRISLVEHPILVAVGVWTFIESLTKMMGRAPEISFVSFYGSKINEWYQDKTAKSEMKHALELIANEGNCTKHGAHYAPLNAQHIAGDFHILEPLIVRSIVEATLHMAKPKP